MAELANMDEVKRSEILRKMTTERDLKNQMAYAMQVGLEEGRERGYAEGKNRSLPECLAQVLPSFS